MCWVSCPTWPGVVTALRHRVLPVFLRSCFCIQPFRDTSTACQTLAPVSRNPTDDLRSHGPDSLSDSPGILTSQLMPLAPQVKDQTPRSRPPPPPPPWDPGGSYLFSLTVTPALGSVLFQPCVLFGASLPGMPCCPLFSGRKFLPSFQTQLKGNSHSRKDAPNPPTFPLSCKKL